MMYSSPTFAGPSQVITTGPEVIYTSAPTVVPAQQPLFMPKAEQIYIQPAMAPMAPQYFIPPAPPTTVIQAMPALPPKGWVLSRFCVILALLLLLTAMGLGIAAAAGKPWIGYDDRSGLDINGVNAAQNAKVQISFYTIWVQDIATNREDQRGLFAFLRSLAIDRGVNDGYTNQFRHSVRACRALVIVGICLAFIAALLCIATVVQYYNWRTYRMLRIVSAIIAFLSFGSFLTTFIIWVVVTQNTYTATGTPAATIRLFCSGCYFGWPTWLCLAAFICAIVAVLCLIIAMEPKRESWKIRQPQFTTYTTTYQTPPQFIAPPPTPAVPMLSVMQPPTVTSLPEPYVLVNQSPTFAPPTYATPITVPAQAGTVPYYY